MRAISTGNTRVGRTLTQNFIDCICKYDNNQLEGNGVTTRTSAFAPLSSILIAVFLNAALNVPDASATDVTFTNFQGAWAAV